MFRALAVLVALCFALLPQLAEGATPAAEQPPAAAAEKPPAPAAPPNEAVGEWSIQATQRLSEIRERLSGSSEIEKLEKSLAVLEKRFDENLGDVVAHPDSAHVLTEAAIRDATSELDTVTSGTTSISEVLAQRSAAMEAVSKEIGEMIKRAQSAPRAVRNAATRGHPCAPRYDPQRIRPPAAHRATAPRPRGEAAEQDSGAAGPCPNGPYRPDRSLRRTPARADPRATTSAVADDVRRHRRLQRRIDALPRAGVAERVAIRAGQLGARDPARRRVRRRVCARFVSASTFRNRAARRQNIARRHAADLGRTAAHAVGGAHRLSRCAVGRAADPRTGHDRADGAHPAAVPRSRVAARGLCAHRHAAARTDHQRVRARHRAAAPLAAAAEHCRHRVVHVAAFAHASIPVSVSAGTCHRSSDG